MPSQLNYISNFKKISQKNNNYLITGAAGTGKSYFLIQFIKYLITIKDIAPGQILVFTFNRKNSKFYREEISSALGKTIREIHVMTFYSFCLDFINRRKADEGLNFLSNNTSTTGIAGNHKEKNSNEVFEKITSEINLLTAPQQWDLITAILENLDEKQYFHIISLLKNNDQARISIIQEIFDYILRAQENLLDAPYLSKKFTPYTNKILSEINNIYYQYNEKVKDNDFFDYGRILLETANELKNSKSISDFYKRNFEFIIVDDFQEVNLCEFAIINHISNNNIIFFGNDDQSIYAFRGSNLNNYFKVYEHLYPKNVITLKENFRNNFIINEFSGNFISRNNERIRKKIKANKDTIGNGEVTVTGFNNIHDELNFILNKIYFLKIFKKINLNDIAIILKGSEFEKKIIENFLFQNNIPYHIRNPRSIPSSKYVKYILNVSRLCVLINEFNKKAIKQAAGKNEEGSAVNLCDELIKNILFSESLNINPVFFKTMEADYLEGLTKKKYENIWEYMLKNLKNLKKIEINSYHILLRFISSINIFSRKTETDCFKFFISLFCDPKIGFYEKIKNYDRLNQNEKNLIKVLGDYLESIKNFSADKSPLNTVYDYIDYIESLKNNQFVEEIEESTSTRDFIENDGVRIISFYESRNYNFEAVFIPFLNKGYLPSNFSKSQTFDLKIFQMFAENRFISEAKAKIAHLEQERKILYMGISRARNYLYVTCNKYKSKSPFFLELYVDLQKSRKKAAKIKEKFLSESDTLCKDDKGVPEISSFNYFRNKWLLKKKALVAAARIEKNLYYDRQKYENYLIYLKTFYNPENWWNLVKPTENMLNPFEIYRNYFSYSSLETYDACPFKYKFEYFFKIKNEEKKLSILIGSIYHEIIRRFFKESKNFEFNDLAEIAGKEIERASDKFKYEFYIRELRENVIKDFQNFYNIFILPIISILQKNRKDGLVLSEKKFEFELTDTREIITGKIDFIKIDSDREAEIIDFKSSSNKYSDRDLEDELQLKIYKLAAKLSKSLNEDNINLKNKEIILKYYFLGKEKDPFLEMPDDYYKEDELIERILKIIQNIKNENFDINPKNFMSCYYCDYKIFCEKYYGSPI
ncbi:MAG: ATP-dependent helicase [Actinobacteria bacterium]|nr:ATP-dependent helicase [Actinomycetota bacterium]